MKQCQRHFWFYPCTDYRPWFALAIAALAIGAGPWNTFKHDAKRTGHTAIVGAQTNSVRWFRKLKNFGIQSSPVIGRNGILYVGSVRGTLFAFRPDGKIKWRHDLGKYQITAAPAIAQDGTVYVASEDGILHAFTPHGNELWTHDLKSYAGPSASAVLGEDGTIYIGAGKLYAIHPGGTLKWSYDTGSYIAGPPAIGNDGSLYFASSGYLYALDATGAFKWRTSEQHGNKLGSAPAVGRDGSIYMNTNDGTLHAFKPDGTLAWTFDTPGVVADVPSSPAIATNGTIYFGGGRESRGKGGYLYAIRPDGGLKWKFFAGCDQTAPTVGGDGTVYFGSNDCHTIRSLSPDGTLKWEYENVYDYARTAPIIGRDGTVYAGLLAGLVTPNEGGLIAFGP